ncbi:MAG: hypothetical protein OEU36_13315 [Gammaproteobacteria bacterium]|nr:hypothetical protein [Gammaproteobacteria bacterium]
MRALITNAHEDAGMITIRSLARAGFVVHSLDTHRLAFAVRSRYVTAHYDLSGIDDQEFEYELLKLVEQIRPDVLLPLGTRAVRAASRHRAELLKHTSVNVVHSDGFWAACNKSMCMTECQRVGIATPATYNENDALEFLQGGQSHITLVVKPGYDIGAAASVHYVKSPAELRAAVASCTARFGSCIIQDFIPGGSDAMNTVVLLFTPSSRLAAAFTLRKIRQWPTTGGSTAVGVSTADHDLIKQVLPFFERWKWCGVAEVELKLDPRDGIHKVIEINPRHPGYIRFLHRCGIDFATLAAKIALNGDDGTPRPLPAYRVGETYVSPTMFIKLMRQDMRTLGMVKTIRRTIFDARGGIRIVADMLTDPLPLIARTLMPPRQSSFPFLPKE